MGRRRERTCFYFINRICKSAEIQNQSLGCKLLVCKDWIKLSSRLGSAENWCSQGTGTCCATHSSLQRPLLPGASAFRDTESQVTHKVWADLKHLFKCKLKRGDFILQVVRWLSWKGNFYCSFSCMSGFIWCSPYGSIRILSVTMSTFLEQNLKTKAPSNQGIRSSETILVLFCVSFCFSTFLITF